MAKVIEIVIYCTDGSEQIIEESDEVSSLLQNGANILQLHEIKNFCRLESEGAFQVKSRARTIAKAENEWEEAEIAKWQAANNTIFVRNIVNIIEVYDELAEQQN